MARRRISEAEEAKLIEDAKKGDLSAIGMLIELYLPIVTRYLISRMNTREVEDVAQEVFLKMTEQITTKFVSGTLQAWLFEIARFEVMTWREKKYREGGRLAEGPEDEEEADAGDPADDLPDPREGPEAKAIEDQAQPAKDAMVSSMQEALRELPALQREIVAAKIGYKRSAAELAKFYEVKPVELESMVRGARTRLARVLGPQKDAAKLNEAEDGN